MFSREIFVRNLISKIYGATRLFLARGPKAFSNNKKVTATASRNRAQPSPKKWWQFWI
jgi:hypothetical protein